MTKNIASIELARLYETQGYYEDALSTYKLLAEGRQGESSEIRAAVNRLERLCALGREQNRLADPGESISRAFSALHEDVAATDTDLDYNEGEKNVACLIEQWLTLMVVRKRLQLFKKIRSRL